MSSQVTPNQVKTGQKSINSFFCRPKQAEVFLTPSEDQNAESTTVITPVEFIAAPAKEDESSYEIDRLVSSQTVDASQNNVGIACEENNPSMVLFQSSPASAPQASDKNVISLEDEVVMDVPANKPIPSNVSTMPPLPPRVVVPKKRKAAPKTTAATTQETATDGDNESGEPKETPKKRVYKKKAPVPVTPGGDSETEVVAIAEGADGESTEAATSAVKPAVKRPRKPAVKKTVAPTSTSDSVPSESAVDVDAGESSTTENAITPEEDMSESTVPESNSTDAVCTDDSAADSSATSTKPAAKKTKTANARALKALESYNYTGAKEVMAEKRVAKPVDYTDSSLAIIDALLDGRSAKTSAFSSTNAAAEDADDEYESAPSAAAAVLERVARELSPELQAKITANQERVQVLVGELLALEGAQDMRDQGLEVAQGMEELVKLITTPPALVVVTPAVTAADAPTERSGSAVENDASTAGQTNEGGTSAEPAEVDPAAAAAKAAKMEVVEDLPAAPAEEQDPNDMLAEKFFHLLRAIEARSVQGTSLGKAALVQHVADALAATTDRINAACADVTGVSGSDAKIASLADVSDAVKRGVVDRQQRVLAAIEGLSVPSELEKECDVLATRKHFGSNINKTSVAESAEDMDQSAVWRWHVNHPVLYFTTKAAATIREVNAVRSRYSKAIKAIVKVIEDLASESCTAAALAASEDKVGKCMVEVEKAKDKRRELEVKRQAEAAERAAKEAIKEAKRREKEESDLKKKQLAEQKAEAAAQAKAAAAAEKAALAEQRAAEKAAAALEKEKKEKVPTEKELKQAQQLEKQKNALKGFFSRAPAPAASATVAIKPGHPVPSSSSSSSLSAPKTNGIVCLDDDEVTNDCIITTTVPATATSTDGSSPSESADGTTAAAASTTTREVVIVTKKSRRLAEFERALAAEMTMEEVQAANRKRAAANKENNRKNRSKRRKPLKLYVTVNIGSTAFADPDNTYSEIRERVVDSRIRTLSFAEDHRPAYVGTFSKRSAVITGRRPLAQDDELFNYDEDSEGEWEEEVEGEDIMDSGDEDGEDGGEGNELVYDDFFRRDNDYGSDAESDVEGPGGLNTASAVNGRDREEVVGPRFIHSSRIVTFPAPVDAATPVAIATIKSYRPECANDSSSNSSSSDNKAETSSPTSVAFVACTDKDTDSQRLSQYATVLFTSAANPMPYLGAVAKASNAQTTDAATSGSGKKGKKRKTTDAATADCTGASPSEESEAAVAAAEGENKPGAFKGFDETKLSDLVTLVHGKKEGIEKLVLAFHGDTAPHVSKVQIKRRILEVADKVKHADGHGSQRWSVKQEIFDTLGAQTPAPLEFTPAKKPKKRAELIRVSGPPTTTGSATDAAPATAADSSSVAPAAAVTSVSSFINTFMPAELLVPVTAKPAVAAACEQAVPSTPKKSTHTVSSSSNGCASAQSNKITSFVTLVASPVKAAATPAAKSSSSSSSSQATPLASSGIAALQKKRATPVSSNSSACGSASKRAKLLSPSSQGSRAVPEVIELMDE